MSMRLSSRTVLTWVVCALPCTGWNSRGTGSQCFLENFLTTEMKATGVEIQKVNWTDMKLHLLKILLMFKQIDFQWLDNNFILDTNKVYCEEMKLGFPIEDIVKTKNTAKAVMGHRNYQILTNVIHFQNLSLLSSKNHRAFLETKKMASVLKTLE